MQCDCQDLVSSEHSTIGGVDSISLQIGWSSSIKCSLEGITDSGGSTVGYWGGGGGIAPL